jgi:tellurite resistance protein TehA-like permease
MISHQPASPIAAAVAELHPASFAMVMATGIVSVAAELQGFSAIAVALLWLNVPLYVALWILTAIRVVRNSDRIRADLTDHGRSVGFFTIVAATCVLGNQFVIVTTAPRIAIALWLFGIVLWTTIMYTVFTLLTVKSEKPGLAAGLNGGWLVTVVASQAVAVLGGLLAPHVTAARDVVLLFVLVMWLGGGMLYIWIIVLIFYRYTFLPLDPRQLAPPYWINMGAVAISTLAGCVIAGAAELSPLLAQLLPFTIGMTLLFWATATWWIPLLVILGVWRHVLRRVPLTYDVVYWSAVFPLGMYTVCTHRLAHVIRQEWLLAVPRIFVLIAMAAWAATFLGLLRRQLRLLTLG